MSVSEKFVYSIGQHLFVFDRGNQLVSRVLEKLLITLIGIKFHAICGTRRFVIVF
jgi:hypothetical protein